MFSRQHLLLIIIVVQQSAAVFLCNNSKTIDDEQVCDGINQCRDSIASDECGCSDTIVNICANERCILEKNLCDGRDDCGDDFASDERNCTEHLQRNRKNKANISCGEPGAIRCSDQLTCIHSAELCDGKFDCPDESDEQYSGPGFKCVINSNEAPTCVLPQINLYDNRSHCFLDADLCFDTDGSLTLNCFACLDGIHIISKFQVCDGVLDCADFSDECLCEDLEIPFLCQTNLLKDFPKSKLSTSLKPAADNRSKSFWLSQNISCGNGMLISSLLLCDGVKDCVDGEDETYCFSPSTLTYIQNMQKTFFPLRNTVPDFFDKALFQNNSVRCYNQRLGWILALVCDNIPMCDNLEDECRQECRSRLDYCHSNASCLKGHLVCDGKWDSDHLQNCSNARIPEEEAGCINRFYCVSGGIVSVRMDQVCDGVENCKDGSDESKNNICKDERFYCETFQRSNRSSANPIFIPKALMLDGKADCKDGSDECPATLNDDTYSYKNDMISRIFLTIILWVIGPLSFFGNIYIFSTTVHMLRNKRLPNLISIIHHTLIANLAVADGLMGLYLISLCVVSVYFSGNFCSMDKTWRASYLCKIMGTSVLVSTQASVFILLLMGMFRLYTVLKPLEMQFSKNCYSFVTKSLIVAWIFALLLGLFPWVIDFSHTQYYFKSLFFDSNCVLKSKYENFLKKIKLGLYENGFRNNSTIFRDQNVLENGLLVLKQFKIDLKPNLEHGGELGFYSKNAICLPNYLTHSDEPGWKFTLFVITLNFIFFVLMAVMYFFIAWFTNPKHHPLLRESSINPKNKMKLNFLKCRFHCRVARLLLTDFLCWIPLCCLSYAHFSGVDFGEILIAICGIVLLPINSALNPILYSGLYESVVALLKKTFSKTYKS